MKKSNTLGKQARTIKMFLFVPLLSIVLFVLIPMLLMVYYSFTDWDGYSTSYNLVGLANYQKLFTTDNIQPLANSFYYLSSNFFQLLLGAFLAIYIYFQKRYQNLTLIIILIPILLNTVAVGLIFRMFLTPGSAFDMLLDKLHIINFTSEETSVKWIGNSSIVGYTLGFITFWRYTSYSFLLIYGSLLSVDRKIVKAAIQQGASKFQIATYVLLPNIKTTLIIVITMLVIGGISTVELPMIMTGGKLGTQTIVMRIQEIAFSMRDFGLASSLSLFVCLLIIIIIFIKQKLLKGDDE